MTLDFDKFPVTADGIAGKVGEWKVKSRLKAGNVTFIAYQLGHRTMNKPMPFGNQTKLQAFNKSGELWATFDDMEGANEFIQSVEGKYFYAGKFYDWVDFVKAISGPRADAIREAKKDAYSIYGEFIEEFLESDEPKVYIVIPAEEMNKNYQGFHNQITKRNYKVKMKCSMVKERITFTRV